MAATIIAALSASAALANAGTGIYSAFQGSSRPAQRSQEIGGMNLENALANQDYMKLLNTIGLARSSAGTTDSEGNETYYDPATNTWRTKLGDKPAAVQAASENAAISRNTTDLRQAQAVNEQAMRRAALAAPGADAARREVENFRPETSRDVTDAIVQNIVNATNQTNEPLRQDVLRNAARTGSAADSQITALGRSNADAIRRSIAEATIAGRQGVGQVNASNLAPLVQKYSTLYGGTQPQLQYSQIDNQNPNAALATLTADRAKSAGVSPFAGMQGLGYGQYGVNQAATGAAGTSAPDPTAARTQSIGGQISNLFKDPAIVGDKDKKGLLQSLFGEGEQTQYTPRANDLKGES